MTANVPLLMAALLLIDGLHFVFARALRDHIHPVTSVMFVLGTAAVQVALFARSRGLLRWETFRRHAVFFLAIGALIAITTTTNYTAVAFVDPGTASLLAQTSILFGVGFGVWWLRERLTRNQIIGAAAAIVGAAVITFQPGDYFRLGSLMVIGSSALYALHAAIVKRYGGGIGFVEFFLWRLISTAGFLFVSAAAQGLLAWPSPTAWALILLTGTVDVVISRALYYLSLRQIPISIHSLVLTLSPVVAILWTAALFGVVPAPRDLIGGVGVLIGIAIVTRRQ